MPDPANCQAFLKLFDKIEAESKIAFHGAQLACISRLVFYCGVQKQEIPQLLVRDLVDQDGRLLTSINRFEHPILLRPAYIVLKPAYEALERYLAELKEKPPKFLNRKSNFFPDYRNVEKLKRDWKRFGTNYREIRKAAFYRFVAWYYSHELNWQECAEQLRVGEWYFQYELDKYRNPTLSPL